MIDKIALKESIDRICKETGFQLYDWHIKGLQRSSHLSVYITKPSGVSLENCEEFSRLLGDELDMRDVITTRYFLEVSSPGLERPILLPKHFEGAIGEELKVTYLNDEMKSETVTGELIRMENDMVTIQDEDGDEHLLNLSAIKKARTVFKWPDKASGSKSK